MGRVIQHMVIIFTVALAYVTEIHVYITMKLVNLTGTSAHKEISLLENLITRVKLDMEIIYDTHSL